MNSREMNFQETSVKSSRRIASIVLSSEKLRRGTDVVVRRIPSNFVLSCRSVFKKDMRLFMQRGV